MKISTLAFLFTLLSMPAFCQDHYAGKLQQQLLHAESDTVRMVIAAELDIYFLVNRNQDSSFYYFHVAERIAKKLQITTTDVYKTLLSKVSEPDSIRALTMSRITSLYSSTNSDSALFYGQKALDISRQIGYPKGEANAFLELAFAVESMGDYPRSMELSLKALQIAERYNFVFLKATAFDHIGNIYLDMGEYSTCIPYYHQSMEYCREVNNNYLHNIGQTNLLASYLGLNQLDSALYYGRMAEEYAREHNSDILPWTLHFLGQVYLQQGNRPLAFKYLKEALERCHLENNTKIAAEVNLSLAKLYKQNGQLDSSIFYAKQGLSDALQGNYFTDIVGAGNFLSALYESTDTKEALHYSRIATAAEEDLYTVGKKYALKNITDFDQKERDYEIKAETTAYKNIVKQYILLAGLGVFLLIAFILFRNNRQKNKANKILEKTLSDLKVTQSQLIQSEKMASLGELTAGIAHEIQNPLNFVNNFSEVNEELLVELKDELEKGNIQDAMSIANDAIENQQKIKHHGKRADGIVKSMLQHSQKGSGQKELTDINALCDEYLRLSYHGLRARDKTFNAKLETDFDITLEKINVMPQDIGRVILNLVNNAFYAVREKQEAGKSTYAPIVSVSTKKEGDKVFISVKDNGSGIPESIKEKIMQPFFTTKPTGQGTGLGLSLSYDIIKTHGGELRVETREGEGTVFVIILPLA